MLIIFVCFAGSLAIDVVAGGGRPADLRTDKCGLLIIYRVHDMGAGEANLHLCIGAMRTMRFRGDCNDNATIILRLLPRVKI